MLSEKFKLAGLVAIVILGLLGGLLHHHASEVDCAVCALCHSGVQTPVADLAAILATPFLGSCGIANHYRSRAVPSTFSLTVATPRAPPLPNHHVMLREGCLSRA